VDLGTHDLPVGAGPDGWQIQCPACRAGTLDESGRCPACPAAFPSDDGVWRLLDEERRAALAPFLDSYSRIRLAEGRTLATRSHFESLPECPAGHPVAEQWRIRRQSFQVLSALLARELPAGARVLDLGAGSCWLSNRLAKQGLRPCAVDINLDEQDGLRANRHYDSRFACLEAEFDRLPLPPGHADAAVLNASLHYCTDLGRTLREVLRVLKAGGMVVVVDSPIYHDAGSGRQMVIEQHRDFERRFGDRSDHLASIGYLTFGDFDRLAGQFGLQWNYQRPWYGWRWALRPLLAGLRGQREPATFAVVSARKPQGGDLR
jgi:SAM-dependent methyltransferase